MVSFPYLYCNCIVPVQLVTHSLCDRVTEIEHTNVSGWPRRNKSMLDLAPIHWT